MCRFVTVPWPPLGGPHAEDYRDAPRLGEDATS